MQSNMQIQIATSVNIEFGTRFRNHLRGEYILSNIGGGKMMLINLVNGFRWRDAVDIKSPNALLELVGTMYPMFVQVKGEWYPLNNAAK
jgi:hypothetical protein